MKTAVRHRLITLALLALSTLNSQLSTVFAQGTAFTYQGRLYDGPNHVTGSYDLTFALFTDRNGVNQVGGTLTNTATGINNGLFTVGLDFGQGVFTGSPLWLQIGLETNGGGGVFTLLTPLQQLTPTPYAIYASSAGSAATANSVAAGSVTGAGIAANSVVKSLNSLQDAVTLAPGANVTITPSGNTLTIASSGGGGGGGSNSWSLAGNSGTTPGVNFLGTTDDQSLELHVNGLRGWLLEPDDNGYGAPNVIGGSPVNNVAAGVSGATIGGGGAADYPNYPNATNSVTANFGTVGGGLENTASYAATVAGGVDNGANGIGVSVGGGNENQASALYSTIGGGWANNASADEATVGGGSGNQAIGAGSVIGGGGTDGSAFLGNVAFGLGSTVAGGLGNTIGNGGVGTGDESAIGGGSANTISGSVEISYATIGGGQENTNAGYAATIGGGGENSDIGPYTTIGGGLGNVAGEFYNVGTFATVGGGRDNVAGNFAAFVGGGAYNQATGPASCIGGGSNNIITATGVCATVPGGAGNTAQGVCSMSAGQNAAANDNNSFVWSDGTRGAVSQGADTFTVLATGGAYFFTTTSGMNVAVDNNADLDFGTTTRQMINLYSSTYGIGVQNSDEYFRTAGQYYWYLNGSHNNANGNSGGGSTMMSLTTSGLTVNGTFVSASDRNLKEHFQAVDDQQVLAQVSALPISRWNYKADTTSQHIGPMAQDFYAAFAVGPDDKHITTIDEGGIALAAIQGLNQKLTEKDVQISKQGSKIEEQAAEIAELKQSVAELKNMMQSLASQK